MRCKLGEQGFTLIELLIALALIALVGSGLMSMFWIGNNAFARQSARSEAQYADRTAMQQIIADIKQSTQIILENGDLGLTVNGTPVLYHLDSADHQLLRNGIPIAENITSFIFSAVANLVSVEIMANVNGEIYTLRNSASPRTMESPEIIPGNFLATDGTGNIYYSDDGISWEPVPQTPDGINDVDLNNNILVAVGDDGLIYTLVDGTWEQQDIGTTEDLNSVSWGEGEGQFVAVGDNQTILVSANGTDWYTPELVPNGSTKDFTSVAYGEGKFVAVGDHNEVYVSSDGTIWQRIFFGSGEVVYHAIAYGNGIFVMVGDALNSSKNGTIYSSVDAITWIERDSGVQTNLNGVACGGGVFAAVGDGGVIIISSDAAAWNRIPDSQIKCETGISSLASVNFKSMYYGSGLFVGVGVETVSGTEAGRSLISSDGSNWTVYPVASDLIND